MADLASIRKAAEAKNELTATAEAFEKLRQSFLNRIANTTAGESEAREALYHGLKAIDMVRQELQHLVDNGKVVEWADTNG